MLAGAVVTSELMRIKTSPTWDFGQHKLRRIIKKIFGAADASFHLQDNYKNDCRRRLVGSRAVVVAVVVVAVIVVAVVPVAIEGATLVGRKLVDDIPPSVK